MHRHHISERSGHFYEQWHQKLHNNTTPDDIPICEALLSYLKSGGDMSKYWEVLTKNGIDRNRLCSYERKITEEPYYLPNTIHDFQEYLKILKQLHSSGDIQMLVDEARGHLGGDVNGALDDLLGNFKDADTLRQMERATNIREKLSRDYIKQHEGTHKVKDVMFLDLALEQYVKTLSDRIMHIDIGFIAYVREVGLLLRNLAYSFKWEEMQICMVDWFYAAELCKDINNQENARKVKSIMDRLRQMLGEVNDTYAEQI
jgi:alpha-glucan,water dikinase